MANGTLRVGLMGWMGMGAARDMQVVAVLVEAARNVTIITSRYLITTSFLRRASSTVSNLASSNLFFLLIPSLRSSPTH